MIPGLQHCGNGQIWRGWGKGTSNEGQSDVPDKWRYTECMMEILEPIVTAGVIKNNFILMQNNVCSILLGVCMDYLNHEAMEVMDWLAHSHDLNPIKRVGHSLQIYMSRHDHPSMTIQGLT